MPVPNNITDVSTVPSSNTAWIDGSVDAPAVLDDHARTQYAFIRQLYNVSGTQALLKAQLDSQYVLKTGDTMTGSLALSHPARLGVGAAGAQYGRVESYWDGAAGINPLKSYYALHWGGQFAMAFGLNGVGQLIFGVPDTNQNLTTQNVRFDASGAFSIAVSGIVSDPYGRVSVTLPSDASNYSYYSLTRAGQIGIGHGITTANRLWWGNAAPGFGGTLSGTAWLDLGSDRARFAARLEAPAQPGFSARRNAGFASATSAVLGVVTWDSVTHNVGSAFNGTSFVAPAAGRYLIGFNIRALFSSADNPGASFDASLSVNLDDNTRRIADSKTTANGLTDTKTLNFSDIIQLNVNDDVRVRAASSSANAVTVSGIGSNFYAHFLG